MGSLREEERKKKTKKRSKPVARPPLSLSLSLSSLLLWAQRGTYAVAEQNLKVHCVCEEKARGGKTEVFFVSRRQVKSERAPKKKKKKSLRKKSISWRALFFFSNRSFQSSSKHVFSLLTVASPPRRRALRLPGQVLRAHRARPAGRRAHARRHPFRQELGGRQGRRRRRGPRPVLVAEGHAGARPRAALAARRGLPGAGVGRRPGRRGGADADHRPHGEERLGPALDRRGRGGRRGGRRRRRRSSLALLQPSPTTTPPAATAPQGQRLGLRRRGPRRRGRGRGAAQRLPGPASQARQARAEPRSEGRRPPAGSARRRRGPRWPSRTRSRCW